MDFESRFDVLVAGAGVAGVAAALESARRGARTALVEKTVLAGGLATSGLVNVYLPLCDGRGRQVVFGIAEELLHLSIRYGPGDVPACWRDPGAARDARARKRLTTRFSPAAFALALDEALEEAGVETYLDTLVCDVIVEDGTVRGVEVENKSGRGALVARCVVDATGDADVANRAGADCVEGESRLSLWAEERSLEAARRGVETGTAPLEGVRIGADDAGRGTPEGSEVFRGVDGGSVTRFVLAGRRLLRERYRERQGAMQARGVESGRHAVYPATLPTMAQFRTTRRIVGQATVGPDDCGRRAPDSVGLAPDWRAAGRVWEIPYGSLVPAKVKGLLAAGRCISSDGDAWEVTRVIPVAALTGEVAGLAAATAAEKGVSPGELDVKELQSELSGKGFALHLDEFPGGE